jgi:predicted nucleotidyltransferase
MQKYTLDTDSLSEAIRQSGFRSLSDIAQHLGYHRNTLGHFARGESVFPKSLHSLFNFLGIDGRRHIRMLENTQPDDTIVKIVDEIIAATPHCCIVLFGSRARGNYRPYSDYDLGIFSASALNHEHYLDMIDIVENVSEDFAFKVQLVNLCKAEKYFLKQIGLDLKFLGGRMSDWIKLKEKVNGRS